MSESLDQLAMASEGNESVFDDLVESLTARLQAGERLDVEEIARRHPEHADRLRRLLPALAILADFGDSSPREIVGIDAASPGPGHGVLGDFRIIREVGRGGMGVVYEAQQLSLDRRVALKVLPLAAAIDSRQLQRFQLEAHAAACLHHTNIVPVYAVGCERGVPFYAMQFIEGRSLAQVIAELRRHEGLDAGGEPAGRRGDFSKSALRANLKSGEIADRTTRHGGLDASSPHHDPGPETPFSSRPLETPLPGPGCEHLSGSSTNNRAYVRTVAQLGIQVAEALDHAHTRGILHRDIKPANLLLDQQGQLWVTDFGLAQIQGNPSLTMSGDVLGTLRYMSPEQALAKRVVIDGRTDIYSLGATLYELLTLRPAFDGKDRQEILKRIAEEDPRPLRQLNSAAPRDLDTILSKAIAKEPSARYATAKDLALDLRRFLENKSIAARRPSSLDRAVKWARRYPGVLGLAALLMLVTLVGLSVSLVVVSRERARTSTALAAEAKRRAQAREALDAMTSLMLGDLLARQPALTDEHRKFLGQALQAYEEFAADTAQDEASRAGAARALANVARIRIRLSRSAESVSLHRRAVGRFERLAADFPAAPLYRRELASAQRELARALFDLNQRDEGLSAFTAALTTGERLIENYPWVSDYRHEQAQTYFHLGVRESRPSEQEWALQKAIALVEPLVARSPEVREYRLLLGRAVDGLSSVLASTGRSNEALRATGQASEIFEQLVRESPASVECRVALAKTYNNLANRLRSLGRPPAEIEKSYRDGLAVSQRLAQELPAVPVHRQDLVRCLQNLALLMTETKRTAEAESLYRDALAVARRLVEDYPIELDNRYLLSLVLNNLAELLRETRRAPEAEKTLNEALGLRRKLVEDAPDAPAFQNSLAVSLLDLAELRRVQKQFQASSDTLGQALAHHQAALKTNPKSLSYRTYYANNRKILAENHVDLGDHRSAAAAVTELEASARELPSGGEFDYAAAVVLARCAVLARNDSRLADLERSQMANEYASHAVDRLRAAIRRGFKNLQKIKSDHDLDVLRTRDDFRRLLAEVDTPRNS
jgi:serine/threonine-protein kinase